jgi:hypothetical protein
MAKDDKTDAVQSLSSPQLNALQGGRYAPLTDADPALVAGQPAYSGQSR